MDGGSLGEREMLLALLIMMGWLKCIGSSIEGLDGWMTKEHYVHI